MKQETFEKLANKVHGSYTYGPFKGLTKAIEITCPEHGPFTMTPNAHINGLKGCPLCLETPSEATVEPSVGTTEGITGDEEISYVIEASMFDKIFNGR